MSQTPMPVSDAVPTPAHAPVIEAREVTICFGSLTAVDHVS